MTYETWVLFAHDSGARWTLWTSGPLEDCLDSFMEYRCPHPDFPASGHGAAKLTTADAELPSPDAVSITVPRRVAEDCATRGANVPADSWRVVSNAFAQEVLL